MRAAAERAEAARVREMFRHPNMGLKKNQQLDNAPTYLSEKVGQFNLKRRSRQYDEILEIEVRKETLLETEKQI